MKFDQSDYDEMTNPEKRDFVRKLRAYKVEVGQCFSCEQPARPGYRTCEAHKSGAWLIGHQQYARRKQAGVCTWCGGEPNPGKRQCETCRVKSINVVMKRYKELKEQGICIRCKKRKTNGKVNCDECVKFFTRFTAEKKVEAFNAYGGCKCKCCGDEEVQFLTLDHIEGGGNKHRKEELGKKTVSGIAMYNWAKKNGYPPIFQVLCMNCNFAKGMFGECPHETKRKAHNQSS